MQCEYTCTLCSKCTHKLISYVILVKQTVTAFISHSSYLIRFLVLILGAFTPPPQILDPVINIPLKMRNKLSINASNTSLI